MKDESSVLLLKRFEPCAHRPSATETITGVVFAAAGEADATWPGPSNPDEVSPQVMLRLITYCYAKGVYGSGEIERKLRKSPIRQAVPDARTIQRFRRCHRTALQRALEKTLQLMRHSPASDETLIVTRREASEKLDLAAIFDISLEE